MENMNNDLELIEKFLEGSLEPREKEIFLKRIETETVLAEAFNKRKLLQKSYIEATRRIQAKNQIRSIITDEKRRISGQRKIWLAAASLVILATIGSVLIYNSRNKRNESQYAKEQTSTEGVVQGSQNKMDEFGNMDVVSRKESVDDFFPDESTLLTAVDTISFKWPSSLSQRFLTIYNNKGELVQKITIRKNVKEYLMMPGVLKPGVYYWKFMNDTALIRITVSN